MKWLITADLHLTDRPQDEYRWDIFPWLRRHAALREVDRILFLGDLTDRKDHHSAQLVNRLLAELSSLGVPFYVLMGNHDYVDPGQPFFDFIDMIRLPTRIDIGSQHCLFIPHTKNWAPASVWRKKYDLADPTWDFIFCHNTFDGAESSSGYTLSGPRPAVFNRSCATIISGDVHVPQQVGVVTYVGSPHPVAFGDTFKPRVLFWNGERISSIERTTLRREIVRIADPDELLQGSCDLTAGDHVKVILEMRRRDLPEWDVQRQHILDICEDRGFVVFGVSLSVREPARRRQVGVEDKDVGQSPDELLNAFCGERGLDSAYVEQARSLLGRPQADTGSSG